MIVVVAVAMALFMMYADMGMAGDDSESRRFLKAKGTVDAALFDAAGHDRAAGERCGGVV